MLLKRLSLFQLVDVSCYRQMCMGDKLTSENLNYLLVLGCL